MINYCADMGYEVTINIMAISTASENELDLALELLAAQSKASVIYLVDSYGSLYPEQIRDLQINTSGLLRNTERELVYTHTITSSLHLPTLLRRAQ